MRYLCTRLQSKCAKHCLSTHCFPLLFDLHSSIGATITHKQHGVTVVSTVPTLLRLFDEDIATVRLLILGGEVRMRVLW